MEAPKAPTAPTGGVWGGMTGEGYPLPSGVGSGEKAVPLPRKIFGMFFFKMVHF